MNRYKPRTPPEGIELLAVTKQTPGINQEHLAKLLELSKLETQLFINLYDSNVIVAIDNKTLLPVGFVAVERSFAGKFIRTLFIHPDYRRKGIGSLLVEQVVKLGVFHDATFVEVAIECTVAQELFECIGFVAQTYPNCGKALGHKVYRLTGVEHNAVVQLEEDRQTISNAKQYVHWSGSDEVTLDGSFDIKELKAVVRFMENKGPGTRHIKHQDL